MRISLIRAILVRAAVLAGVLAVASLLVASPPAMACSRECSLQPCWSSWSNGWTYVNPLGNYNATTEGGIKCIGFEGDALWYACYQYYCGASAGKLFHVDDDVVSVFSVRSKEEAQAILVSINKDGLAKTYAKFAVETVGTVKDFLKGYRDS